MDLYVFPCMPAIFFVRRPLCMFPGMEKDEIAVRRIARFDGITSENDYPMPSVFYDPIA